VREQQSESYRFIGTPRFSEDGKRIGLGAMDGSDFPRKVVELE
jgi:hypothetical protein